MAWCLPPQVQTPAPPAASPLQTRPQPQPPAKRRAQPVPLQRTSAASPVGRLLRLQETSWTLHTLQEAPALALPTVCSLSRRKEECVSASMEYHATCYR
ncbi:hypothetical protein NDU88_008232 [Pleurodeles waltl]|uniref:Uncharacterized protein n=1 Tax=Pleurodeles waltl TaxID=8319 RepID=A0AAV7SV72_PLEWA|nr:hypothetical protein NDU88_008232 [Pleurodeles waltl]